MARFVSPDTLVQEPTDPQSLNRYSYVNNNPVNHTDPTGNACDDGPQTWAACFGGKGGSRTVMDAADRYNGYRTWTYIEVTRTWRWPNGRLNAVAYTRSQIERNLRSADFKEIVELNSQGGFGSINAATKWADMVGYGKPWDHKDEILSLASAMREVNPQWQQVGESEFRYDTWSNIHYGVLGSAIPFSGDVLLTGASVAQALNEIRNNKQLPAYPAHGVPFLQGFDPPEDRAAVQLGITLWNTYGDNGNVPTEQQMVDSLLATPNLMKQ